jgi:large subunit ribosomal protein L24
MKKLSIKKNDTVIALSGSSAGKTGKVLQVLPAKGRALVEGLNMLTKTLRKSEDNPQGGIIKKEGTIDLSNLLPYCTNCKKGVRTVREKDGKKSSRKCKNCGHLFD